MNQNKNNTIGIILVDCAKLTLAPIQELAIVHI